MNWVITSLQWYLYLFALGLIFFPLTAKIFPSFFDKGYSFAKTLGILFLSFAIFILSILKILPFDQLSLFFLIILFLICSLLLFIKQKTKIYNLRSKILALLPYILFQELLFLASFIFLTFVRGQEPSIHGLEKFMDFGFINSILRSKYFPPLDMWYSADLINPTGYPINYYYFGHLTGAVLIKLTSISPAIGYNLILATIFAQGMTLVFSIVGNLIHIFNKYVLKNKSLHSFAIFIFGLLGSFVVNLGGNLHTIYLFTSGYSPDNPVPFWEILSAYNPTKYWYPNATRFIPLTIHEFPSYSYVVADLHGHVFDIPFVLLTLAVLFNLFIGNLMSFRTKRQKGAQSRNLFIRSLDSLRSLGMTGWAAFLGFLTAVHYMTNAFDGPIYMMLIGAVFLVLFGLTPKLIINLVILIISFLVFSLPFSINFSPFVSGIGVNCSPDFLVNIEKIGPFLFEKGNCQADPFWMLFILWGFFWISFIIFLIVKLQKPINNQQLTINNLNIINSFIFILFSLGTFLVIIPEFFYIKDIYPAHFRANTMFKLGYQAFIMMGIASVFTFYQIRIVKNIFLKIFLKFIFIFSLILIIIYPLFSFPSYYGKLDRPVELDGIKWLELTHPQDKEIIDFFNKEVADQPVILEAQGDSYTDYERISAYTGLPTVAGWWVHEWLWRGSPDIVGKRIPDVVSLYESRDINITKKLIDKYHIKYIVVSKLERDKYKNLFEDKFSQIGTKVFTSSNGNGAVYQTN